MLKKILFILFLVTPLANKVIAQTLKIGKPNFDFSQACANSAFNSFEVRFNFSTSAPLDPNNQLIVELSDPEGDFAIPTVLYQSKKGELTNNAVSLIVSLPITASGENYQIRVRATEPAVTSSKSSIFPAYYKAHDSQFTINNTIPSATYCAGGSYVLSIDSNGNGVTNSPLQYSFLSYNWYRDNSTPSLSLPPTLLATATSGSYTVSTPGVYYVETNYGTCTSDSYSNYVTVTEANTTAAATVVSSLGNPFCSTLGATILSTTAGKSYQWLKDDVAISGATNKTFSATSAGKYSVKVDYGGCQANGSIVLQEYQMTASLNVPLSPAIKQIVSGESFNVVVATDANNPTYKWYLNETLIEGVNLNNYLVEVKGKYKVIVTEEGTCNLSKELSFIINDSNPFADVPNIPNLISPNGDFVNDTWILPNEYVNGSNAEVMIISGNGNVILQTTNYQNDWPSNEIEFKNINPVYYYIITTQDNKVRKGSITVIK
ncbi:gliding motility-associated C-terminal domain-containing protein [Flavobacterium sp. TAB 87]|uniref:T9SS type B sorting domain-containing protein n=1 Tax=Flavobacterium sp. TAB 87 TaxID=1729581 RepID=UPI00076C55BF|nr:gliding motility-associated C-terminal domain-containing protein [Flavobacterium sp. TAB 87]KVV13501.1 hypothetical protein AP058_02866 [Flavobacterium sp. TAB 87]